MSKQLTGEDRNKIKKYDEALTFIQQWLDDNQKNTEPFKHNPVGDALKLVLHVLEDGRHHPRKG